MIQDIYKGIGSGVWTVDASPYKAYQFQAFWQSISVTESV